MANPQDPNPRPAADTPGKHEERFTGPKGGPKGEGFLGKADDEEPPSPAAAAAKSPLEDKNWRDQSQGPGHPLDDSGHKKD